MPPRYAYWTILIDGKATAFRAHEREELLPTFNQLARKNTDIVMRYFARGRLWDNPEQAQWASRNPPTARPEPRDRGWRPGGEHKDPRARFEKRKPGDRDRKPVGTRDAKPFQPRGRQPFRSAEGKTPSDLRSSKPADSNRPDRGPHAPGRKPYGKGESRPFGKDDRREPRFEARTAKRPGGWRPSKRKPR